MFEFQKDIDVDLFWLDLFPSHYIDFYLQMDMTDTINFEKAKVQNSVRLKYKFYKAILKVSSFWRGFCWSTYLDSRFIS